jgi:ATP-dependent RNA helicase DeaD
MGRIREGKLRFLVATDVAARGIDISHLTHVINHDFPENSEGYVHRTGRTGRAGRTGTAISLVTPKDVGNLYLVRLLYKIRPFERMLPSAGELKARAELDVLQFFQEAYASRETHPEDLAMARRLMTHPSAEHIIGGLLRDHLGARPEATTHAAEARRSKNPTPPATEEPVAHRAATPSDRKDRELHGAAERRPREVREGRGADRQERGRLPQGRSAQPARMPDERVRVGGEDARRRAAEGPFSEAPRTLGAGQVPPGARARVGRGAPHASYTQWEPPLETDDDRPILREATQPPTERASATALLGAQAPEHAPRPGTEGASAPEAAAAHVFINVGKRDGVHPRDVEQWLVEAGLALDDIAGVRVRDRMTFIDLRTDHVDRVVAAVTGKQVGTRTVNAERARVRN